MTHTVTLHHQPWLVASDDDLRQSLTCVWFDPAGVAVATDTVAMAIVPCFIEGDGFPGALVPASFLKEAWRQCPKGRPLTLTFCGAEVMAPTKKGGNLRIGLVDAQFPNWRRLVPGVLTHEKELVGTLGLNPWRLVALSQAIGIETNTCVAFASPQHEHAPHLVMGTEGAFGLLMPMNVEKMRDDYHAGFSAAYDLWQKAQGDAPVETPKAAKKAKKAAPLPAPVPVPEPEAVPAPVAAEDPAPVPEPEPLPAVVPVPVVPSAPARPLPAWLAACLP